MCEVVYRFHTQEPHLSVRSFANSLDVSKPWEIQCLFSQNNTKEVCKRNKGSLWKKNYPICTCILGFLQLSLYLYHPLWRQQYVLLHARIPGQRFVNGICRKYCKWSWKKRLYEHKFGNGKWNFFSPFLLLVCF